MESKTFLEVSRILASRNVLQKEGQSDPTTTVGPTCNEFGYKEHSDTTTLRAISKRSNTTSIQMGSRLFHNRLA